MTPSNADEGPPGSTDELWAALLKEEKRIVCNHLINYRGTGIEVFFPTAIRLVYDATSSRNASRAVELDGHEANASPTTPRLTTRETTIDERGDKVVEKVKKDSVQTDLNGKEGPGTVADCSSGDGNANLMSTGALLSATRAVIASPQMSATNGQKTASASVFGSSLKSAPSTASMTPSVAADVRLFGTTVPSPKPAAGRDAPIFTFGSNPPPVSSKATSGSGSSGGSAGNLFGKPFVPSSSNASAKAATERLFGPSSSEKVRTSTAIGSPNVGLFGTILANDQNKKELAHGPASSSASGPGALSVPRDLAKTSQSMFGGSIPSMTGLFGTGGLTPAWPVTSGNGGTMPSGSVGLFDSPSSNGGCGLFGPGPSTSATDGPLAKPASNGGEIFPKVDSGATDTGCTGSSTATGRLTEKFAINSSNCTTQSQAGGPATDVFTAAKRKRNEADKTDDTWSKMRKTDSMISKPSEASRGPSTDFNGFAKTASGGGIDSEAFKTLNGASSTGASSSNTILKPNAFSSSATASFSNTGKSPAVAMPASTTIQMQGQQATLSSSFSGIFGSRIQPFSESDPFTRPSSVGRAAGNISSATMDVSGTPQQSNLHETNASPASIETGKNFVSAKDPQAESVTECTKSDVERNLRESLRASKVERSALGQSTRDPGSPPDSTQDHFIGYREMYTDGYRCWFQSNYFLDDFKNFSPEEARLADYNRGQRWGSFPDLLKQQTVAPPCPVSEPASSDFGATSSGSPSAGPPAQQATAPIRPPQLIQCIDCKKMYDPETNHPPSKKCYRHSRTAKCVLSDDGSFWMWTCCRKPRSIPGCRTTVHHPQ